MFDPVPHELPVELLTFCDRVRARGARVWLVGGTVRDACLGLPLRDLDLASACRPVELVALLAGLRGPGRAVPVAVDLELGTCTWRVACDGVERDVVHTTFRVESEYGIDRRPRAVAFVDDAELDAPRRDFTVNALYADPLDGTILDPVGGLEDLAAGRFRAIGEPVLRLAEDPLRILRAVRLEARTALRPMPATAAALARCAPSVAQLVPQRRFAELDDLVDGRFAVAGAARLLDTAVLAFATPWLGPQFASVRRALDAAGGSLGGDHVARWRTLCGGEAALALEVLAGLEAPRALRRAVAERYVRGPLRAELVSGRDFLAFGVAPGPELGLLVREAQRRIAERGVVDRDAACVIVAELAAERVKRGPDAAR